MPFINRQDIPAGLRAKSEKELKTRLRQALLNPVLTVEQKESIRSQLASIGTPRVYTADSMAKPGAIRLIPTPDTGSAISPAVTVQEPPIPEFSKEVLDAQVHDEFPVSGAADLSDDGLGSASADSGSRSGRGSRRKSYED